MTSRPCRLITAFVPILIGAQLLRGQAPSRFDAGAGAGGSAFGWQPTVGLAGSMQAVSLGSLALSWQGALDRVAAPTVSRYELMGGARLSTAAGPTGWWLGASAVRRDGFKDAVERP